MLLLPVLLSSLLTVTSGHQVLSPHIIFILADDLGYNDVGYHNTKIITPNIDNLAREGIILEQHYAQFQCTPSRSALMTARLSSEDGVLVSLLSSSGTRIDMEGRELF